MSNTHSPEVFTSTGISAELDSLKARRDAIVAEVGKAQSALTAARAAIDVQDQSSIETATAAQSRVTVLSDAGQALEEQIVKTEEALRMQVASEQRVRDLREVAGQRTELEAQKASLKSASMALAGSFQSAIGELMEGMQGAGRLANSIGFSQSRLGLSEPSYGWGEGFLMQYLGENDVPPYIQRAIVTALREATQLQAIAANGVPLWSDTPRDLAQHHGATVPLDQTLTIDKSAFRLPGQVK